MSVRTYLLASSVLALGLAAVTAAVPSAFAQQQKQAPAKGAAPPAAAPAPAAGAPAQPAAGGGANQTVWVKLCETATVTKTDPATKAEREEKLDICLTHHERLDGSNGMVIVSAALREVIGTPRKHLMVMVPLGVALPAGLQVKIDDEKEATKLAFTMCHEGGCTAEIEASEALIGKLKKGKQMVIAGLNAAAQPVYLPVPLNGFEATLAGKPIDPKVYNDARGQLMASIERRQIELLKKAEEEAAKGGGKVNPPAAAPAPAQPQKK